jgi:beta-lactamase regulating signal transducer with metallopeptidase domain
MITQAVSALFNACWQGLAIFAVTAIALRFFSRSSAATRYAIWFTALIAVAALPAIDFGLARASLVQTTITAAPQHFTIVQTAAISYPKAHVQTPSSSAAFSIPTTTLGYAVAAAPGFAARLQIAAASIADRVGALLSSVAVPVALAWLFLTIVMLYRLGLAYIRLRRVKFGLRPLDHVSLGRLVANSKRPVYVGVAEDLTMPCVLGFAKPAIALPARLATELTNEDLERIVRHEHAHVRRWDDVANALQLVVQAIMCLNPAVHLISRSINVEREIACDDFAVEPLAERVQYAKCLTHIAVSGFGRGRALPAPGFFFNRKQLLVRVERLLERGHNGSTNIASTARFALAGLALVVVAVARVQLPVVAASVAPTTSVGPTFMVGQAHAVVRTSPQSPPTSVRSTPIFRRPT